MPAGGVSVAQLSATVTADTSDFDSKMAKTDSTIESYSSKVNQATGSTKDFASASGVMATGASGIAAGLALSVMAAGDFQATVNEIGAVSGATADELTQLSDMALQVGKDTAFSAQEGAQAIAELSKAGVTVPDILNGAAMATANLAAAAGVDMPRAAEIMSNAMNMFKISGSDSARVADVLAAAANTSAASVDELATGFSQAGPSAAALGLSLEDTAAALALFADRGLSGSDAGTSLKTMLASLTPATKPAKEAFAELGLVTEESGNAFFDAQGNFVGMEAAADTLYDALKDLTDQQRAQYLETIFGSDASRAAELMFQAQRSAAEGTGRGYDDYRAAVEASGQATDVAEAKMKGMNGAIEQLRGSIETAQIVIGTTFTGAVEAAANVLTGIVNVFLNLPGPVQTAIAGVTAGAAAFLAVGSAVGFIIGPLGAFTAALAPMAAGILAIAAPLALVTAAIAAFAIAYKTNFLGFGDAVDSVVAKVTTFASQFGQIFDLFSNGSDAASGLTQRIEGFGKAVEFTTGLPVADFFSGIASALDEAGNHFASIQERISELMGAGFTPLQAVVRALREEFPKFSGAIAAAGTVVQNFFDTVQGIASGLGDALNALRNGDWGGVFEGLLAAGQAAVGGLINHFQIIGGALIQAFNAINWGEVSAALQTGLQNASSAFQQWFGTISQNLITWFQSINWDAVGGMLSTGLQTAISAMGDVASLLLTKGAELIAGLSAGFAQAWPTVSAWLGQVPTLIGAAIAGAGSLAEILVTKGAELIGGLATGFAQKWPEIAAWLSTVPTLIGAAVTASGDVGILLLQKGVDLITGLLTGIQQKWPEIETWLGTVKDLMSTAVGDLTQALLAKGSDLMAGLRSGIDQKWPEVDAWLAALPQDITETVGDLATTLQTKGSELMTGLRAGIDEKWPEIDSWLATLPQDISDTVGDLAQTLSDKGTELIQGLADGIEAKWPEVETWLGTVKDLASTAVGDLTESIKAHGTELITGLSTGAQDFWTGTVEPWLGTIGSLALAAVGELADTLTAQGTALIDGLRHGAQDLWNNQLGPWLQSLPGLIVSAVGDLSQTLVNAGASIISGLISGIDSMIGSLTSKLGEVTALIPVSKGPPEKDAMLLFENGQLIMQGLIDGINSKLEPLRDFLRSIGASIPRDLAQGIDRAKPAAVSAAKDLGDTIAETVQSRLGDIFDLVGLDSSQFRDSGKKAGKDFTDAINETTGDPSDYEVGSDQWHQALQEKIANSMGDIGREGGKRLKKGLDEATSGMEDVGKDLATLAAFGSQEITGVQKVFNNLTTTIADAGASSSETAQALGLMGRELATIGGENTPKEIADLAVEFNSLSQEIFDAGGKLNKDFTARIEELSAKVPGALQEAGLAFGHFGDLAGDDIGRAMGSMLEQISATLHELVDIMRDAFGMAAEAGTDAFADTVSPGLKAAIQNSGEWIADGAKDWESALITTGEWAGQTIGKAMANGMSAKEADWLNQMGFVVDRAIKKGVEGGKKGASIGEATVKQAGEGVRRREGDYQQRMTEMVSKGADAGKAAAVEFKEVGEQAVQNTTDGMNAEQLDLLKAAETTVKALIKVFGDKVQDFYNIGKNYMIGFARGMDAGADEVLSSANDIGKSAEKELRKATESQSPSHAAYRVGSDVSQGFADGISSGEEEVGRAADRLWKRAWQKLKNRIKDFGFLGREWAVDFWQGMLDAPDMTGPLAAWITDQMVAAAKTALQKIQAQLAGIAAQLDIARNLPDPDTTIPQVPQPEPVDTTQRDLLQAQLDATKELTAALEKAFTSAFDAAHKAHVAFVKGQISESEYQAKLQIAQNAYAQKQMNAAQVASLEAQVKAAQDAIDKETAARQKAYEEAVKAREAQVEAERQAQAAQVKQLEQAQRDAQMEMTQTVIDEANKRISQYEKELKKATDPKEKAELKAKIALEKERIDVANQLAGAITAANNATNDFDLSVANAQIDYFTAQLEALGQVDVGGMLQGIADAMLEAANKIAQAADKMKNAFRGGGKGKGEKDKGGATQDASDPSLGGGGMGAAADGGGVSQEFDKIGKAARKAGDDVNAGMGVADMAIRKVLGTTLPAYVKGMGDAGTKGGEALGKNASVAIEHGEASMSKTIVKSVEGATLNGVKIGADRGKEIGVTVTTNMETGVKSREREVTKTVDGVVKDSTGAAVPTAEKGGTKIGDGFITFTSRSITQGQSKVAGDAKQMMTHVGQQAQQEAQRTGKSAGTDFSKFTAQGVKQGEGDVKRAGKQIMDGAGQEAKRDANRLGKAAGDDLGRGVAEGIRGRINDVRQAAKDLADAANSGGGGGGGGGNGGGGGGNGGGGGGGGHRRDAVVEAQQLGTRVGDAMATGVADGVRAQTRTAEQAAVDLVQATNQAARKAAQAHSPSKLFMRLGNDIGDGLVIGLHDRKGDAQDAAQALIYTPKGLPGGRSGNSTGFGGEGHGGAPVVVREYHFHGDIHVPNARVFEDIVDRKTRMNNVAASRGQ